MGGGITFFSFLELLSRPIGSFIVKKKHINKAVNEIFKNKQTQK